MLNQMPLNQAFLERLLFRHQTWEDLIFLVFCVCIFYLCNLFYFLKKMIA